VFLAELQRKVPVNDDDLIPANLPRQALRNEFFALLAVGRQPLSWDYFPLARDPGVSGIDSHKPGLLLSMRQQKRQASGLQNV
jgi:hypothetical protein